MSNYVLGWSSGGTVAENAGSGITVGVLSLDSASFPAALDQITVGSPSGVSFSVDPSSGTVYALGDLNFEANGGLEALSFTLEFSDGSSGSAEPLSLTVTDVAEAPDGLTLSASSIDENSAPGTVVASLTGSDPEGGALTFALVSGAGFAVVGNQLRVAGPLDHEANGSVNVTISVTDAQNNASQFTRAITIADVAEAPDGLTLSASSIDENSAPGTVVASLTGSDPEGGALTFALVSGAGFAVVGNQLRVAGPLDHEANGSVNVTISVTDAQNNAGQFTRAITIADVAEAPDGLTLSASSIDENSAPGTVVASLTGSDPEGGALTFALVSGAGFAVVGNQLQVAGPLDHEANGSVNVTISVTDAQNNASQFTRAITIADVAEAPDGLTLSASSIDENSAPGTVVANMTGSDPEGGALTFALVSGAGFAVVGNQLQVAGPLDHEATASRDLVLSVTDAQSHTSQFNRSITIADINEAPRVLPHLGVTSATIGENAMAGREVARVVVADQDLSDTVTLSLIGPDATMFVLDGTRVRLAQGVQLDHASAPSLYVGVLATDQGGLTSDQSFTVHVAGAVSQASSLQAILGGGNGGTVGLTVAFTDEGPVLSLGGASIVLSGQQSLLTADGELSFGSGTALAQLERLFQGIAGRHAGGMEIMAVADQISRGATAVDLAQTLLNGPEFTGYVQAHSSAPGVDGLGNGAFAELVYNRVLGRGSDSDGLTYWTAQLDGGLSRATMANFVVGSAEAQGVYAADTRALWAADAQAYQVRDLYDIAFNREPDAGGLAFWRGVLEQGASMHTVADAIVGSAEFQAAKNGLSTGQIVEMFYRNGLERASDAPGLAFWTGVIDQGSASLAEVLLGFADSAEQTSQFNGYFNGTDIFV